MRTCPSLPRLARGGRVRVMGEDVRPLRQQRFSASLSRPVSTMISPDHLQLGLGIDAAHPLRTRDSLTTSGIGRADITRDVALGLLPAIRPQSNCLKSGRCRSDVFWPACSRACCPPFRELRRDLYVGFMYPNDVGDLLSAGSGSRMTAQRRRRRVRSRRIWFPLARSAFSIPCGPCRAVGPAGVVRRGSRPQRRFSAVYGRSGSGRQAESVPAVRQVPASDAAGG